MLSPKRRAQAKDIYRRLPAVGPIAIDALQRRRHPARREPAHLNVMTSLGGDDADVLQVMLLSLSQSHSGDQIDFWLFHLTLSQDKLRDLAAFCDRLPNLTLHVIAVRERKDFAQLSQLGSRPFGARFLWYIAHQYLAATICALMTDTTIASTIFRGISPPRWSISPEGSPSPSTCV